MKIAVTGHRAEKLNCTEPEIDLLFQKTFLEVEPELVIVGMATGADLLAGIAAIKTSFPVWAVIPWAGHEFSKYNTKPDDYKFVKHFAQKVIVLNDSMAKTQPSGAFQFRNEWMVDNATHLLAYWDGSPSGTKNCVDYALEKNMKVRNLYGRTV